MELVLDNKKIAVVVIAFAVMAAGMIYLAWPDAEEGGYNGPSVGNDLSSMSWQDVLAEAKGQNVNLSFYQDSYNCQFFDEVLIPAAKKLGINVTYGSDLGYIGAMKDEGAMNDGGAPMYDMYWMGVSGYMAFNNTVWWGEDWKSILPNVMYLTENTDEQVSYALNSDLTSYVGNEIEFSGGQLVMIYNHDMESPDLAYNEVKLTPAVGAAITVTLDTSSTATMSWASAGTGTYKSTELVRFLKNEGSDYKDVKFGLPADYTEVFEWSKIYPGQFTYCNPVYTSTSYYIGYSFMYGALYELESDGAGGWQKYSGPLSIKDRAAAIDADLVGKNISVVFGVGGTYEYLFKYMEDLKPYVHQQDGKAWYPTLSNDLYRKMIGYSGNPSLPENGSVMLTYSVVTSQYNRLTDAGFNTGIYSLETSIKEQYCWTINKESKSKAGAMVIANLLQEPEIQAAWYRITGEIINLDLDRYKALLGDTDRYEKNFGFLEEWKLSDKKWAYIDPVDLATTAVGANPSKYYIALGTIWGSRILA